MAAEEILLVTNYFPPEKGAASNRLYSLAKGMEKAGFKVQVVCPMPNYPTGSIFKNYKGSFYKNEKDNTITIHRLWLWASNSSNKFLRLLSMISFSLSLTLFFFLKKKPTKIFIQYSPVFVGFTAVFWSWIFGKKRILNVSDLWPLAGLEMGLLKKGVYYSLLEKMERFCYQKSNLLIGQSQEIITHAEKHSKTPTFLYRNIPDFSPPEPSDEQLKKTITLVYAGLLGVAQGIFTICNTINLPDHITFHIFGAGPEAEAISKLEKKNIIYHGEVDRLDLHSKMLTFDIAFIPLTNRIYGSVPSKIFEYTRLGLPVLYFAGGEGGNLVEKKQLGWNIPASDFKQLQSFISNLTKEHLLEFPKKKVQERSLKAFNFETQFEAFIKQIESV